MKLRDYLEIDRAEIFQLNDWAIPNVTPFSNSVFALLTRETNFFRVATNSEGKILGFLLAVAETSSYGSLNFQWFKVRYSKFTYIDRIVIAENARGLGIGKLLYADLAKQVAATRPLLLCEVNLRPANPQSMSFHNKLGFFEVGQQTLDGGSKTVAMLAKSLTDVASEF